MDLSALAIPKSEAAAVVRFATFNTSLYRSTDKGLAEELQAGCEQATKIVAIIRCVNPDVLLLNELDYDEGISAKLFLDEYLNKDNPNPWKYSYASTVNTGVDSGLDLNDDGKTGSPNDAWGYGTHPGQYGMLIVSRFAIDEAKIRTFQNFRWHNLPNAQRPMKPDGEPFYDDKTWQQLRLSSKSHWDVPIDINGTPVHLLVAHPTPPVFDGPEDRNGKRNHDEIALLLAMANDVSMTAEPTTRLIDDAELANQSTSPQSFVIAGDLNADPRDGDGSHDVINELLTSPLVNASRTPASQGAIEAATLDAGKNAAHSGDAATDTCDFEDRNVGNLRCDYLLPSRQLKIVDCGVFWPTKQQLGEMADLLNVSDHRLVWADLLVP